MEMSKTRETPMVEWNQLNWRKLERVVFKLQKRIYKASQRGDVKTVRRLQKTLMRSWSAKCLAVRKVTQDNQGKRTAGVDGVKSLAPKQRQELVTKLRINRKAKPTRRVWIPKPGTKEKRPLGIPTMSNRALQALVKLALEPEWEARFEPNSYGFRPGRSIHDAIGAIFSAISKKANFVLDADIAKCFDRINHEALLEKLNTFPTLRRQVRAWLKAGVMDGNKLFPTEEGTPQGGVISPLLANIALHGMEEQIRKVFPRKSYRVDGKKVSKRPPILIRYADDFVVLHEDIEMVQKCQQVIQTWLSNMGLELKPFQTRLCHTLNEYGNEKPGFDFLGFSVRQYPVGIHSTGRVVGIPLGFKTFIKPSSEKLKAHIEAIGKIIDTHRTSTQKQLIGNLTPVIQGWANNYRAVVSKEAFSKVDDAMFHQLRAWANRRHPNKDHTWVVSKYWLVDQGQGWVFAHRDEGKGETIRLTKHSETPIVRHAKVQGNRSPYDGDWIYWSSRMGKHPGTKKGVATLLKKQNGKCAHCGMYFKDGDKLEIDHKTPKSKGGKSNYDNLQILHRHCHDIKTVQDTVGTQELDKEWLDANPF